MQTMRVRKGDLVHILTGKDRGKQGRVIDARPKPMRDSSRMGGTQMTPGGVIDKPAPVPVDNVMVVCPTCNRPTRVGTVVKEVKGGTIRVRVCKRADCGQEIDR